MAVEVNKIDSNFTNLRVAEEESLGVLPGSPIWYDMEPNSYADFGGELALVARNPISALRQRRKGVITDLDASGGFNQDLTYTNLSHFWPGLFLADYTEKGSANGTDNTVSFATGTTIQVDGEDLSGVADGFAVGDIVFISGADSDSNNGIHIVTGVSFSTDTTITFAGSTFTTESFSADTKIQVVGYRMDADDASITKNSGELPVLNKTTGGRTFLEMNLRNGEFIYIGGDAAANQFPTNPSNNGFARIAEFTATTLTFDKTSGGADGITEMVAESLSGGEEVDIFFGRTVANVSADDPDFDLKTWQVERSLGEPNPIGAPGVIQTEVLKGALVNEVALNISQADKITTDWTLIATDNEQRDGVTPGELRLSTTTGSIANIEEATAYNTSSDFSRIRLAEVRPTDGEANRAAPSPLFAYATEITLNASNNASPNKAVGVLGAFDVTAGTFELGGTITAYFADVAAVKAVRNNADVTVDIAIVKDFGIGNASRKSGIVIDVPLIALGDGRLNVSQDEAITLPLDTQAAIYDDFGHTVIVHEFDYLPDSADS